MDGPGSLVVQLLVYTFESTFESTLLHTIDVTLDATIRRCSPELGCGSNLVRPRTAIRFHLSPHDVHDSYVYSIHDFHLTKGSPAT